MAINESLRAEVQRETELLNQKQNGRSDEKQKNPNNCDDDDLHTSEVKTMVVVTPKLLVKRINSFLKEITSFQMPKNFTLPTTLKLY